jgi:hypothetical protein
VWSFGSIPLVIGSEQDQKRRFVAQYSASFHVAALSAYESRRPASVSTDSVASSRELVCCGAVL